MSKQKQKEAPKEAPVDPLWIYPGERRPVIVRAKNERHARHKVTESQNYDGFPVYVVGVEKFLSQCFPSDKKEQVSKEEYKEKKSFDGYMMTVCYAGAVSGIRLFFSREEAFSEMQKLSNNDALSTIQLFKVDVEEGRGTFLESLEMVSPRPKEKPILSTKAFESMWAPNILVTAAPPPPPPIAHLPPLPLEALSGETSYAEGEEEFEGEPEEEGDAHQENEGQQEEGA